MAKKKKKQRQHPLICPYCHSVAILRPAEEIYKNTNDTETKMLYVCKNYPQCNTYIRVNPKTNKPIGVMANKELRTLRREAHERFDLIYKKGILSKQDAYKILFQNKDRIKRKEGDEYGK